jgi:hypothetical protein
MIKVTIWVLINRKSPLVPLFKGEINASPLQEGALRLSLEDEKC